MDNNEIGFIPVDEWGEESFAVPIQQFDFNALDKPEDYIREAVKEGREIMPIVRAMVKQMTESEQAQTVRSVLALIVNAKKPKQHVDEIAFACGMSLADGVTLVSLAKKWGVSKQAIQRNVDSVCDKLQIRKTRTMRSQEARQTMKKTNFRKEKQKQ
jgi:hypothetical protein